MVLTASNKDLVRSVLISQLRSITLARFLETLLDSWGRQMMQIVRRLTNLIATCWLLSRLVPSKMTPNEPSPIFFPTL